MLELIHLMQMRGSWVVLSPDSPGSDVMKIRTELGNPGARNKIHTNTHSYSEMIASGKPFKLLQLSKIVLVKSHAF